MDLELAKEEVKKPAKPRKTVVRKAKPKAVKADSEPAAEKTESKIPKKPVSAVLPSKQSLVIADHGHLHDGAVGIKKSAKKESLPEPAAEEASPEPKPAPKPKSPAHLVAEEIAKEDRKIKADEAAEKGIAGAEAPKQPVKTMSQAAASEPKKFPSIPLSRAEEAYDNKKGRPLGLYKKIAFAFVFLTVALLASVFYFAFVKVDIMLIPTQERVSNNLIFDIYDTDKNKNLRPGALTGVIKEIEVSESKKFQPSESKTAGEEVVGRITIVNKYSKSQPLVATTRLLSPDNKLFRLKETINVPAGGSVEAEVYADKISPEMAVESSVRWIIPGLWAGLQDKIYGENQAPLRYQKKVNRIIGQSDIDQAKKELKDSLLAKAKSDLDQTFKDFDQVVYDIDENSVKAEVGGKVGEVREEFTVTLKTKVAVVAFKDEQVAKLSRDKINSTIPETRELIDFDKSKMVYSLNNYDSEQGVATINVSFEGRITLKEDAILVEKEKIVGLTKDQLNEYLSSLPELAGSEAKFSPSFITKVPDLVDRINIEVKR